MSQGEEAVQNWCKRDVLAQGRQTWWEWLTGTCCVLEMENESRWLGSLQAVFDDNVELKADPTCSGRTDAKKGVDACLLWELAKGKGIWEEGKAVGAIWVDWWKCLVLWYIFIHMVPSVPGAFPCFPHPSMTQSDSTDLTPWQVSKPNTSSSQFAQGATYRSVYLRG